MLDIRFYLLFPLLRPDGTFRLRMKSKSDAEADTCGIHARVTKKMDMDSVKAKKIKHQHISTVWLKFKGRRWNRRKLRKTKCEIVLGGGSHPDALVKTTVRPNIYSTCQPKMWSHGAFQCQFGLKGPIKQCVLGWRRGRGWLWQSQIRNLEQHLHKRISSARCRHHSTQ